MSSFLRTFPFLVLSFATSAALLEAQDSSTSASGDTPQTLDKFVVSDKLDAAREDIVPSLGATSFLIDRAQLETMPLGANASFNQVLLRAPGVAQDSAASGGIHVRGEHANLQYRINDVLLPEGIGGFGSELDPRFVDTVQLVTGSLPAQYGFRTAGVVDIHTKSGATDEGAIGVFGGSFGTVRPSIDLSGTRGATSYFADASFNRNDLGIENPTPAAAALHDTTRQTKAFASVTNVVDPSTRVSVMLSASDVDFQVPNTPGLSAGTSPNGTPWLPGTFDSARLDENQNEQNYFAVVAYQKSLGDLNYQAAVFGRRSSVHFRPDPMGDLFFNGVASDVNRAVASAGLELDGSDAISPTHTLRTGGMFLREALASTSVTTVFPVDSDGNPTGPAFPIRSDARQHAVFAGVYAQDEFKLTPSLTLNYGARFDAFNSSVDRETQLSPRVNLIWRANDATTFHVGYARYFTPPPLENVPAGTISRFNGTSNEAAVQQDDPVRAERADYFDAGVDQQIGSHLHVGLDAYDKVARHQLDDGLFGQTLILSSFNYRRGRVYGLELSTSYAAGGFSAYLNAARSLAKGTDWESSQFLFGPDDLAYVHNHWIYLDHDQQLSASAGAAYAWKHAGGSTKLFVDVVHGSGLRNDGTDSSGATVPNGASVPSYQTISLGFEESFTLAAKRTLTLRVDGVNLTDKIYELRDGSGVGVNAAQYGMRRGVFGTVGLRF